MFPSLPLTNNRQDISGGNLVRRAREQRHDSRARRLNRRFHFHHIHDEKFIVLRNRLSIGYAVAQHCTRNRCFDRRTIRSVRFAGSRFCLLRRSTGCGGLLRRAPRFLVWYQVVKPTNKLAGSLCNDNQHPQKNMALSQRSVRRDLRLKYLAPAKSKRTF